MNTQFQSVITIIVDTSAQVSGEYVETARVMFGHGSVNSDAWRQYSCRAVHVRVHGFVTKAKPIKRHMRLARMTVCGTIHYSTSSTSMDSYYQ